MLHSLRFRLLLTMSAVVLVALGTLALFSSRSTSTEFERYLQNDLERDQRIISDLLVQYRGSPDPEELQALVMRLSTLSGEHIIVAERAGRVVADSEGRLVGETLEIPGPRQGGQMGVPFPGDVSLAPISSTGRIEVEGGFSTEAATQPFTIPLTHTLPMTQPGVMAIPVGGGMQPGDRIAWAPLFVPLAMMPVTDTVGGRFAGGNLIVARIPNREGRTTEGGFLASVNQQLLLAAGAAGLAALLLTWLLSRRILGPVEALTAAAGKMERGDLSQKVEVRASDEIGKLAHAFNAMSSSLARQETLRRNMVGDIAHELRTPLSNIRGYLEAARDGMVQPDAHLIASLHEESLLLSRLIEDLQELQLAEAGQLRLEPESAAPGDLMERAATALRQAAEERGVEVRVEAGEEVPPVRADRERIGQVLRNLVGNAITHTASGGTVTLSARAGEDEVTISVADTGEGIAPEHLPNLFERFYRADGSRARTTGGAGLGLAIVKQIVTLHGGRVWAESEPGRGSTFRFTLPLADQEPE
jgi:signal transduction histidine kinase